MVLILHISPLHICCHHFTDENSEVQNKGLNFVMFTIQNQGQSDGLKSTAKNVYLILLQRPYFFKLLLILSCYGRTENCIHEGFFRILCTENLSLMRSWSRLSGICVFIVSAQAFSQRKNNLTSETIKSEMQNHANNEKMCSACSVLFYHPWLHK